LVFLPKNNHKAAKHSRLSNGIDFGEKWLGVSSSEQYFSSINPIFDNLREIKETSNSTARWSDLRDKDSNIYLPVLEAFKEELWHLY
jgi:hypothetical protein